MPNALDFPRFSTFVNGIVDRRLRPISLSITSSSSYLKNLVIQAGNFEAASLVNANNASQSAINANTSATSSLSSLHNFQSVYLGVQGTDPQQTAFGAPVPLGSFYIRSSDNRWRVSVSNVANAIGYHDVQVAPDQDLVVSIITGRFLSLTGAAQTVQGPVNFSGVVTFAGQAIVPAISDSGSYQAVPVRYLTTIVNQLNAVITNELTRAEASEASLQTAITQEATRAEQVETTLKSRLDAYDTEFQAGANQYGYWEKRPSGVLEQWGYVAYTATSDEPAINVTLPVPLPDTAYHISLTPSLNAGSTQKDTWVQIIRNTMMQSGFSVQYQRPGTSSTSFGLDGFEWVVKSIVGELGTDSDQTNSGGTTTGGPGGNTNVGTNSGGSGGETNQSLCPEEITPILLANKDRTGPGSYTEAGNIRPQDWVWTQHQTTMEWGAYLVTHARSFTGELWQARDYYRATKRHPFYIEHQWVTMETIGQPDALGTAVALTVQDAHTFISLDHHGNQVLNHNQKA